MLGSLIWRRDDRILFGYFFSFKAGITQNTVMHLAFFHVFPLQVVGILEINKKVCKFLAVCKMCLQEWYVTIKMQISFFQVFGNGVTDVVLSQGVLVVSYNNKSVKLYSFEHIVQRVRKFLSWNSSLHNIEQTEYLFNESFKHCIRNTYWKWCTCEYLHIQYFIIPLAHLAPYLSLYPMYIFFVFSTWQRSWCLESRVHFLEAKQWEMSHLVFQ